eukprot:427706-Rhodomonas_salina.7
MANSGFTTLFQTAIPVPFTSQPTILALRKGNTPSPMQASTDCEPFALEPDTTSQSQTWRRGFAPQRETGIGRDLVDLNGCERE